MYRLENQDQLVGSFTVGPPNGVPGNPLQAHLAAEATMSRVAVMMISRLPQRTWRPDLSGAQTRQIWSPSPLGQPAYHHDRDPTHCCFRRQMGLEWIAWYPMGYTQLGGPTVKEPTSWF